MVRVRVMSKDKRTYRNAKGEGKLFNVTVADNSMDIRMTGFNEQLDAFYERLVVGKVFLISGGQIKQANPQYNTTKHNCEITLGRTTTIEESDEPQGADAIPRHNYEFTPIAQMEAAPDDSKVDVLAIIVQAQDAVTFTNKKGGETTKRVLVLADTSGASIEATLFGEKANEVYPIDATFATRGAKVGSWNQKSLTVFDAVELHVDLPEAHALLGWWQGTGSKNPAALRALSANTGGSGGGGKPAPRIVFSDIEEQALGLNQQADFFSVRCRVQHIKTDKRTLWYIACPNCKKKVADATEDHLEGNCEKCNAAVQGVRRWIVSARCIDAYGGHLISFFDDTSVQLLHGKTADELAPLKTADPDDSSAFDRYFNSVAFESYIMKCKILSETYQEEARLKASCVKLDPVDWLHEGRELLTDISKLMQR